MEGNRDTVQRSLAFLALPLLPVVAFIAFFFQITPFHHLQEFLSIVLTWAAMFTELVTIVGAALFFSRSRKA